MPNRKGPTSHIVSEHLRWTTVDSSNVWKVRYWRKTGKMDVKFRGNDTYFYRYNDVSIEEFVDVLQAESVGSHFVKEIKAAKVYRKIEETE